MAVNDWRRLKDTLRTWEWIAPVRNRKSEYKNESDNEDSGENRPDNGRDFPFRSRWCIVHVVIRGSLRTQERALLAWGPYSPSCVARSHGIS